jgi:hypothetical protein
MATNALALRLIAFACDKPFSPCDKLPHWFRALLQKFNPAASAP